MEDKIEELRELQNDLYIARQIKDYNRIKRIERKIKKLENEIKGGDKNENK